MSMVRFPVLLIFLGGMMGCSQTSEPEPQAKRLFFASFEDPADTSGWQGWGDFALYLDSTKSEGQRCALVSGGTMGLHVEKMLSALTVPSEVILRCNARSLGLYGGLVLLQARTTSRPGPQATVYIADTLWRAIADTTWLPQGASLSVEILGDISTRVLVDDVEILQIVR